MKSELCNEAKMSWGGGGRGEGVGWRVKGETKGIWSTCMYVAHYEQAKGY
jgi:hypothetical protein